MAGLVPMRAKLRRDGAALFSPPPCGEGSGAGLSQISKEVEEKLFFPRSELHFASCGSFIGGSAQDVERHAAQDSKILRRVILTGSSIVLVEDDVERPVQLIFYAPMRPRHFEHALGRQPFG